MLDLRIVRSLFAFVVLSVVVLGMPTMSFAGVAFSVSFGPPPLPVYEQPYCPGDGFLWAPGYWSYDYGFGDYYWVPGTWVRAPRVGYFWTPGYWAYSGNRYVFYDGYWGPQVGFYGGINYGYGYFGNGYDGGRWERGRFFYNRSVNNVNITNIHNVYNTTIINRTTVNRVSYNGGNGGISARPTREQESFSRQRHLAPVSAQTEHLRAARVDREQRASVNHGRPAIAASPRPGDFKNRVPAREAGGAYNPPANRGAGDQRGNRPDAQRRDNNQQVTRPGQHPGQNPGNEQRSQDWRRPNTNSNNNNDRPPNAVHSRDLPRDQRTETVNTGGSRRDQQRANPQQDQERQKMQQRQEQQSQRIERQRADDSGRQRAEQQQQNQRMEPRREQQPQSVERRDQQPQPRREPTNRDESKQQKKDRPPNEQ